MSAIAFLAREANRAKRLVPKKPRRHTLLRISLSICVALICSGALALGAPFTNGSFESPGGAPIRTGLGCNDPFVTGWTNNAATCTGTQVYESSGSDVINAGNGTYY